MSLSPGSRLGPYEIVSLLGEGGMGQVYRARDTQLGRDVAVKILPEAFGADPDRLMRFEREARTLATLNHTHIAQVYGLESSGASRAIVMELVEGEDLAERIARGPIPVDEALPIAKQIADALETAHEQGIVHRDLKPANIKLRPDGTIKVLDFGLAKIALPEDAQASSLQTITSPAVTQRGVILGTAAYMAPEQARGKFVDRRADLWAFGCVLFEVLTASRAFSGETTTDVLSAIISQEPDWKRLPSTTPPAVARLIRRCLRKDVKARLQSAGDARVEIDEALSGVPEVVTAAPAARKKMSWLTALAFTAAGAAIALAGLPLMRPRATIATAGAPVMRYTIGLPSSFSSVGAPTISPDGRWIAIAAIGPMARSAEGGGTAVSMMGIWLRPMDGEAFQPIAGTEQAVNPIWSPDSREIAFLARRDLYRTQISGGTPIRIADVASVFAGAMRGQVSWPSAAWGEDGTIVMAVGSDIYRVPAAGGTLTAITRADGGSSFMHASPSLLPGNRLLFTELGSQMGIADTAGGLLMRSAAGGAATRLMDGRSIGRYTPQGLLVSRMTVTGVSVGTISAHRFDLERGAIEQPGVVLATDANPFFGVSNTGVLVYGRGAAGADHRIEWVDAKGDVAGDGFDVSGSGPFNLSRDERTLVFQEVNDIMVRDLERGVTTRLVQGPGVLEPLLSPDGRRVAYSKVVPPQAGIAVRPAAGGPEEMVFSSPDLTLAEDWSRDGRFLLAIQSAGRATPNRGVIIPLEGDRTPMVFVDLPEGSTLDEPRFSPDGKSVVYNAADSGSQEVYLAPVPPTGERWRISTGGGAQGRWRPDGGSVFYLAASGQLMEVTVSGSMPPQISRPRVLFDTGLEVAGNIDQYALNATATRFLLRRPRGGANAIDLHVIVNWPSLLTGSKK